MISHICIGTNDFLVSFRFYASLMKLLGLKLKFCDDSKPWAAWHGQDDRPLFILGTAYNGDPHSAGNGQMVAFNANNRAMVDQAYQQAIGDGAKCQGRPGLRPHYHPNYYGAYFTDPDGNKICVVCHSAE
ncbi:VOC family protein [Corallincola platygyrae]|uniref:VOC family protein n=1 Tax=Corallincola platygyrae TaxID=1193278 RepID=A0ABW4XTW0_9GAMM